MIRSINTYNDDEINVNQSQEPKVIYSALYLLVVVFTIVLFGMTMLYSTSSETARDSLLIGASFFVKQVIWAVVGLSGAFAINIIGYKRLASWSPALLIMCIILLIIAALSPPINGAHRWIRIPGVGNIQPSEFSKIALILFVSKYSSDNMRFLNSLFSKKGIFPLAAVSGVILFLVLIGKDWGATVLLGLVVMTILFIAGIGLRYLCIPFLLSPLGFLYLYLYDPERWSRLTTFLDPEKVQSDDGYQLWHSLLALGSGGPFGLGFMQSRMKAKYLPEAHTDFILSIVGEELGFVAICFVMLFYILFVYFSAKICANSSTKMGILIGSGVTAMIGLQAIINIGVVSGALPTKGMPAPFISYGGSNLVVCLCGVGLLVNIAFESAQFDFKSRIPIFNRLF